LQRRLVWERMPAPRSLLAGLGELYKVPSVLPWIQGGSPAVVSCSRPRHLVFWHDALSSGSSLLQQEGCMAARTNPALSTFLDSMFLDTTVGSGTATGESTCMDTVESLPSPEALVCTSGSGNGQAQAQEQHDAGSKDVGCGTEEKAQIPGSAPCVSHHTRAWPAPTDAIGTVIQAYNARTVQLERQCWELLQENKQLRGGLEADRLQREHLSELNLRLSGEVRRARVECTAASAQAERLGTELRSERQKRAAAAGKLRLARRKVASLGSMQRHGDGHSAALSEPCLTQSALTELQCGPLIQEKLDEDEINTTEQRVPVVEPTTIEAPPGLPGLTTPSTRTSSVQSVHNGDLHGDICLWGSLQHATYSRSVMLAHHTLQQDITKGPPGLKQAMDDQNGHVAPRLVTRRWTGAPHRQPRL